MTGQGLCRCTVAVHSEERDFAILKIEEVIKQVDLGESPAVFPSLATQWPSIGMTLGYLTCILDAGVNSALPHFAAVHASQILLNEQDGKRRVLLTGARVQEGMSGSPVFSADATLQGLIAEQGAGMPIMIPIGQFNLAPIQPHENQ